MSIPKIKDCMDDNFYTIKPDMNIYDAIDFLLAKKITSVAVVDDNDHLQGILSEKDCLNTLVHGLYEGVVGKPVSGYMTDTVVTITPDMDILSVASLFLHNKFRRLLVVDQGKIVGHITRRDLLREIQRIKNNKKAFNPVLGKHEPKDPTAFTAKFIE